MGVKGYYGNHPLTVVYMYVLDTACISYVNYSGLFTIILNGEVWYKGGGLGMDEILYHMDVK